MKLSSETIDFINNTLALKSAHPDFKHDHLIYSFTVSLCDAYEVDFKLVNGDDESGPYLDVVLFDDGMEVCSLEPNREKIEGEYILWDSIEDRYFTVRIEDEGTYN